MGGARKSHAPGGLPGARQIPIEEQVAKIEAVDVDTVAAVADRIFASRPTIAAMGPLDRLADYDSIASALAC